MKIPGGNLNGFQTKSNRHMVCGLTQTNDHSLVVGSATGELYEVDLRAGKRIRNYSYSGGEATVGQLSPIVDLTVVGRHVYACHEDYISKWNYGLGRCSGLLDLGFNCSAMLKTSKGIIVGGNIPYLYCLS